MAGPMTARPLATAPDTAFAELNPDGTGARREPARPGNTILESVGFHFDPGERPTATN